MPVSVVQSRSSASTASGSNISLAFASNTAAGNAIHAAATCDTGSAQTISSFQDTSNSFGALLDNPNDSVNAQRLGHAVAVNIAGGADTVQANFSAATTFRGLWIKEIGGVGASPLDGHNGQTQGSPGTGTDGVSSGTWATANAPHLMSGFAVNTTTAGAVFTHGTGYTDEGQAWPIYSATNQGNAESQRFTSTGTRAVTFTASANVAVCCVGAAFDEASNPAPDITPPSRPFPIIGSLSRFPALLRETQFVPPPPPLSNVLTRSGVPPLFGLRPPFLVRSPQTWPAASGPQTFTQTLTATQAETVTLGPRNISATRSVTQPQTATLVKAIATTLAAVTQATVATLLKRAGKVLTAAQATTASFGAFLIGIVRAVTQAETLSLARAVTRGLSATQATIATLKKAVTTALATIAQPTAATLVKGVRTTLATIAQATTATLASIKVKLVTLPTISQATTASLAKSVAITRTVSQATSAARALAVKATRSLAQVSSAVLVNGVRLARSLTQATVATLVASRLYLRAMSVGQATAAVLVKAPQLVRSAGQATTATLTRLRTSFVVLTVAQGTAIALAKRLTKAVSLAQSVVAQLVAFNPHALVSGPRFIISRVKLRLFAVLWPQPRTWTASRPAGRLFTVSAVSSPRFDTKLPAEKVVLTFDFTPDLLAGETLTGSPTIVSVNVSLGADGNPTAIENGAPTLDTTSKKVLMPVQAGLDGCDYDITVSCATSNALKVLELLGTLPVRAKP